MLYLTVISILFLLEEPTAAYKAAVVEYNPVIATTPSETISKNLNQYKLLVSKAKNSSADIIIFPEYGLTSLTDKVEDFSVIVNTTTPLIQELSNTANYNKIYLVVNILEEIISKKKFYNTNLVFDRNGNLILKYQKINLFGEPNLTAGSVNQTNIFETDFGVSFGTMTCFDILYYNPSRTILQNGLIKNIAYPTSWFSTMPFYSSLSVQHGYSTSTKVNLLAANIAEPQNTHSGSGIYLKTGEAKIYINDKPETKLLVEEIPSSQHQSNMNNYKTLRDFVASDYNFSKINLSRKNQSVEICYKAFCCFFELTVLGETTDIYEVMAFDGIVPFDVGTAHVKICSLLICANNSNDSCGQRVKPSTQFSHLSVKGNLGSDSTTFYTPLTLDFFYEPILDINFSDVNHQNFSLVELQTTKISKNVLVFGIFGKTD